jgi:hypothetical protein
MELLKKVIFFLAVLFTLWAPFQLTSKLDRAAEIAGDIRMTRVFDVRHLAEITEASQSAGIYLVGDLIVTFVLAILAYGQLFGSKRPS